MRRFPDCKERFKTLSRLILLEKSPLILREFLFSVIFIKTNVDSSFRKSANYWQTLQRHSSAVCGKIDTIRFGKAVGSTTNLNHKFYRKTVKIK